MSIKNKTAFALSLLFSINTRNFFDRQILGAVGETVRKELELKDTALGLLGTFSALGQKPAIRTEPKKPTGLLRPGQTH